MEDANRDRIDNQLKAAPGPAPSPQTGGEPSHIAGGRETTTHTERRRGADLNEVTELYSKLGPYFNLKLCYKDDNLTSPLYGPVLK